MTMQSTQVYRGLQGDIIVYSYRPRPRSQQAENVAEREKFESRTSEVAELTTCDTCRGQMIITLC